MKTAIKISALLTVIVIGIGITAILLFVINGSAASAQCEKSIERLSKMHVEEISLLNDAGKIINLESHIADDNRERTAGYQHICAEVIDKTNILFVYAQPIDGRFHMQNVKAPLDIGFFDGAGKLIRTLVMDTYDDGNKRLYHPGQRFQYALEARVGFFKEHKLSEGKARLVVHSVNDSLGQ